MVSGYGCDGQSFSVELWLLLPDFSELVVETLTTQSPEFCFLNSVF
jgi:hypothetical protein